MRGYSSVINLVTDHFRHLKTNIIIIIHTNMEEAYIYIETCKMTIYRGTWDTIE
jgi:hypothetical protein